MSTSGEALVGDLGRLDPGAAAADRGQIEVLGRVDGDGERP
jgi:hypothetical protein